MADVVIYTRQMCGFCSAAKNLLQKKNTPFTEHDASFSPALRKEMIQRSNGGSTFPQIFIGPTHIGGCDDLFELERAGKLDQMLAV
jgi:glutaredoxin 3